MRRRLPWLPVVLLAPLLLGAADPPGDLVSCDGISRPARNAPVDIVRAIGTTAEDGLAMRFTITFSSPPPVPDERGRPLRVDVLLRDPSVPELSVDYYHGLNRIVRFDAVSAKAGLAVLLLPERSDSPFTNGVRVDGDSLILTVPSRLVMRDPDLSGFDYSGVRWTVVARDEETCDVLGERARPTERVKVLADAPAPSSEPATTTPDTGDPLMTGGFLVACALAIAVGGGAGFAAARWRRRAG